MLRIIAEPGVGWGWRGGGGGGEGGGGGVKDVPKKAVSRVTNARRA